MGFSDYQLQCKMSMLYHFHFLRDGLVAVSIINILCGHVEFSQINSQKMTFFTFRKGIAVDRLIGFQDLGGKDDFTTKTLENLLIKKGKAFILDSQVRSYDQRS